jgi:hypothetical protein
MVALDVRCIIIYDASPLHDMHLHELALHDLSLHALPLDALSLRTV